MSVAISVGSAIPADPASGLDATRTSLIVEGLLTLSGDYGDGASNGDVLDFSGVCASDYAPKWVDIHQEPVAGNAPVIYNFLYGRGTTQANGVLIVTDFAGAQITPGAAYPAALTDDDPAPGIRFRAEFCKNV